MGRWAHGIKEPKLHALPLGAREELGGFLCRRPHTRQASSALELGVPRLDLVAAADLADVQEAGLVALGPLQHQAGLVLLGKPRAGTGSLHKQSYRKRDRGFHSLRTGHFTVFGQAKVESKLDNVISVKQVTNLTLPPTRDAVEQLTRICSVALGYTQPVEAKPMEVDDDPRPPPPIEPACGRRPGAPAEGVGV